MPTIRGCTSRSRKPSRWRGSQPSMFELPSQPRIPRPVLPRSASEPCDSTVPCAPASGRPVRASLLTVSRPMTCSSPWCASTAPLSAASSGADSTPRTTSQLGAATTAGCPSGREPHPTNTPTDHPCKSWRHPSAPLPDSPAAVTRDYTTLPAPFPPNPASRYRGMAPTPPRQPRKPQVLGPRAATSCTIKHVGVRQHRAPKGHTGRADPP